MAWLLWRDFKVPHPRIARVFMNWERLGRRISLSVLFVFFSSVRGSMCSEVGSAAGRGGPRRSRAREIPASHRQSLQGMTQKKDLSLAVKKPIGDI
jgi:hypothetical protein